MDDPDSLTGWYLRMLTSNRRQLEFVFRDAKQFTGLTHCQARNSNALSFALNASLTSVNIARAFARQQGMDLSVGSTKTLLHNAAMVERFISMSGKHADMRFNNTDFKICNSMCFPTYKPI